MRRIQLRLEKVKVIGNHIVGTLIDKPTSRHLKQLDEIVPILQIAVEADSLASTQAVERLVRSLQIGSAQQAEVLRQDVHKLQEHTLEWRHQEKQMAESSVQIKLCASIVKWLAIADPHSNLHAACQQHLPGTGQWLLEGDELHRWEAGDEPHLWLHALGKCCPNTIH